MDYPHVAFAPYCANPNAHFSAGMRMGYSTDAMSVRCQALNLREDFVVIISELWKKASMRIAEYLLQRSLSTKTLLDMDWSFGVSAASDDCNHVGKTFLQLKLVLDDRSSTVKRSDDIHVRYRTVYIELSLDQFYQLLASLENCKAYLDMVSPTT